MDKFHESSFWILKEGKQRKSDKRQQTRERNVSIWFLRWNNIVYAFTGRLAERVLGQARRTGPINANIIALVTLPPSLCSYNSIIFKRPRTIKPRSVTPTILCPFEGQAFPLWRLIKCKKKNRVRARSLDWKTASKTINKIIRSMSKIRRTAYWKKFLYTYFPGKIFIYLLQLRSNNKFLIYIQNS